MNEKEQIRFNILKLINEYILNFIDDEEVVIDEWLRNGVPDQASDDIIEWIAYSEPNWIGCIESFLNCLKQAEDTEY